MRRRDIDPLFWQDEKAGSISMGAQLLFIWTWNDADDWGVLRWKETRCKSGAFLYRHRINIGHVREYMRELVDARMILPWNVDGESWAVVRTFLRWQSVNKPVPSKCPAPPADVVALLTPSTDWRGYDTLLKKLQTDPSNFPPWIVSRMRDRSPFPSSDSGADFPGPSPKKEIEEPTSNDVGVPPVAPKATKPKKNDGWKRIKLEGEPGSRHFTGITDEDRAEWQSLSPDINIDRELLKVLNREGSHPQWFQKCVRGGRWVATLKSWMMNAQAYCKSSPVHIPAVDYRFNQQQAEKAWQTIARIACGGASGEAFTAAMSMIPERSLDALKQWGKYPDLTIQGIGQMTYQQQETVHRAFTTAWLASDVRDEDEEVPE